jgi:hypothetical protein
VVRDGRSSAPLPGAEVTIATLELTTRTNEQGRYALDGVAAGRHVVIVRRLGYDSASATLPFSGADTVTRDFALSSIGQPLPAVPVAAAPEPVPSAKLREFERRRRGGIGRFLSPHDLEKLEGQQMSDVVSRFPGLVVVRASGTSGRMSGNAAFVASSRGASTIEHQSALFGRKCPVAIWLDGVPVYRGNDRIAAGPAISRGGGASAPPSPSAPPFDINSIMTTQVTAMEFYSGPAQMPAELNVTQGTCGALVIWTK